MRCVVARRLRPFAGPRAEGREGVPKHACPARKHESCSMPVGSATGRVRRAAARFWSARGASSMPGTQRSGLLRPHASLGAAACPGFRACSRGRFGAPRGRCGAARLRPTTSGKVGIAQGRRYGRAGSGIGRRSVGDCSCATLERPACRRRRVSRRDRSSRGARAAPGPRCSRWRWGGPPDAAARSAPGSLRKSRRCPPRSAAAPR